MTYALRRVDRPVFRPRSVPSGCRLELCPLENEEDEALSQRARKNCKRFLIAVPVAIAVFLALKLAFPIT